MNQYYFSHLMKWFLFLFRPLRICCKNNELWVEILSSIMPIWYFYCRSLPLVPGSWLLSLALSGVKQRENGSLAAVIGIRAGITSTAFTIRSGGFIKYNQFTPFWVAGAHPWHPFSGAVGLGLIATMAVLFYPKHYSSRNKIT